MTPMTQQFKTAIYALKRTFGQEVTFYARGTPTTNLDTGTVTSNEISVTVKKAIVVDNKNYYMLPSEALGNGGWIAKITKVAILDAKDLEHNIPNVDDYLMIGSQKCYIKDIQTLGNNQAFILALGGVENE